MVLRDLTPPAKGGVAVDPASCTHWVISGDLNSETGPCSTCNKTWATLVEECVMGQILHYSQAYACTNLPEQSYLVQLYQD